jgi:hypothetical protein
MKNLANLLRKADISPRERVVTLVQNRVRKEKDGRGILTESEIYSLTDGWKPKSSQEAREYNKYLQLSKLEVSMRLDAQMFACRSEGKLLRSHLLVDQLKHIKIFKDYEDAVSGKYISHEEAVGFVVKSTYLDYSTLLHMLSFNNLPKDIQDDLILLDEQVVHDKKYLEDEIFLYELFKNSKTLNTKDKGVLIDRIYSCVYHDGFRKVKKGTEKDGFLLHFFAELPMEAVLMKWVEYGRINLEKKDNGYVLEKLEEYAKDKGKTMEMVVKETLSKWIDDGLFVAEYTPVFFSDKHNTWNGNTKFTHKEIFTNWYKELQKTKASVDKMVTDGNLVVEQLNKEFFGVSEKIQIITGNSLYECEGDIDFVNEYKEQVNILLPLAGICLFIKKYNKPLDNLETLKCFHELSKTFSDLFEVDMSDKYDDFVTSFEQEIKLINHSIIMALDNVSSFLYEKGNRKYPIGIIESNFTFNTKEKSEKVPDDIIEIYKKEIEKKQ